MRSYSDSIKDFEQYNSLATSKTAGFIGLGDAYKGMKRFKEALACYNLAINKDLYTTVLERRALLYFGNGDY